MAAATLIAQITDVHIGFDQGGEEEHNLVRLRALLTRLGDGPNWPDALLLTGDLTEHGDGESYRRLADALAASPCPVWPIPGNHDDRGALLAAFPETPTADRFIQYAVDLGELRVLMLDTFEPGRHGAGFCERRAAWLERELSGRPQAPTLIAMHHPPFATGIVWMDPDPDDRWIARFAEAIRGHDQIIGIVCGHVHRATTTRWAGVSAVIAPSSAPAVALDLSPIDPEAPDGRAIIRREPPGYAMHVWDGRALVSHFETVGGYPSVARFDDTVQPMIREMMAERGGARSA